LPLPGHFATLSIEKGWMLKHKNNLLLSILNVSTGKLSLPTTKKVLNQLLTQWCLPSPIADLLAASHVAIMLVTVCSLSGLTFSGLTAGCSAGGGVAFFSAALAA
jgi:uncharacterized protein YpmS